MRKARFCIRLNKKACAKLSFVHVVSKNTVRYASEKMILTSCHLSTFASLKRKRPHENKITFTHKYRNVLSQITIKYKFLCSCITGSTQITVHSVEISTDPKSPRFGAGPREDVAGLYVDWATEESGLCKDDRLVLLLH